MNSVAVVLQKELRDLLRNPGLIATMVVPVALLTGLAILALYAMGLAPETGHYKATVALPAVLAHASRSETAQYLALSPFFLMWLIFPVSVPSSIAAYSIVGEKEEGTLEPLLATPIRTRDLLLGKVLAAGLPGVILAWVPWLGTLCAGYALHTPRVIQATVLSSAWIAGLLLLAPCLTFLTVMMLVIISSRVNDVRTANQLGAVLVLPLVGLFVSQVGRGLILGVAMVLITSACVLILGIVAMVIAGRLFQRETILVRWKQSR